jgi:hypothetical protein
MKYNIDETIEKNKRNSRQNILLFKKISLSLTLFFFRYLDRTKENVTYGISSILLGKENLLEKYIYVYMSELTLTFSCL